jgi:Tfp pilus assembly protein FimT
MMNFKFSKNIKGITVGEILVTVSIMAILAASVSSVFVDIKKTQALEHDAETIVEVLTQAKAMTISSQNASQYGVHLESGRVIMFSGSTYQPTATDNMIFPLFASDVILTISLSGGGNDVIFQRLTGDTANGGTIVVSSPTESKSITIHIYQTGMTESD